MLGELNFFQLIRRCRRRSSYTSFFKQALAWAYLMVMYLIVIISCYLAARYLVCYGILSLVIISTLILLFVTFNRWFAVKFIRRQYIFFVESLLLVTILSIIFALLFGLMHPINLSSFR